MSGSQYNEEEKVPENEQGAAAAAEFPDNFTVVQPLSFQEVRNLVFEGGGVKGIAHVGAVEEINKYAPGFLNNIQNVSGASAGAIMAFLIALGESIEDIKQILTELDFAEEFFGDKPKIVSLLKGLRPGADEKVALETRDKLLMELFPGFEDALSFTRAQSPGGKFSILTKIFPWTLITLAFSFLSGFVMEKFVDNTVAHTIRYEPKVVDSSISPVTSGIISSIAHFLFGSAKAVPRDPTVHIITTQVDITEAIKAAFFLYNMVRFFFLTIIGIALYYDWQNFSKKFKSLLNEKKEIPALSDGKRLHVWLVRQIEPLARRMGKNPEQVTFSDLHHYRKRNPDSKLKGLYVTGLDLQNGFTRIFSYKSSPNMPVVTAVRLSASLPFAFSPLGYGIDGGALDNYPTKVFDLSKTLGFKLVTPEEERILRGGLEEGQNPFPSEPEKMSLLDYFTKLGFAFYNKQSSDHLHHLEERSRTVYINVGRYKTEHFGINENDKETLVGLGRKAARVSLNLNTLKQFDFDEETLVRIIGEEYRTTIRLWRERQEALPNESRLLREHVAAQGFSVIEIERRGNCLYLSVADELRRIGQAGYGRHRLRNMAATHLVENRESYFFTPEDARVLAQAFEDREWAGHEAIVALSRILRRTIVVLHPDTAPVIIKQHERENIDHIFFLGFEGHHYQSLLPRSGEVNQVVLDRIRNAPLDVGLRGEPGGAQRDVAAHAPFVADRRPHVVRARLPGLRGEGRGVILHQEGQANANGLLVVPGRLR